jgi:hypothetical protein
LIGFLKNIINNVVRYARGNSFLLILFSYSIFSLISYVSYDLFLVSQYNYDLSQLEKNKKLNPDTIIGILFEFCNKFEYYNIFRSNLNNEHLQELSMLNFFIENYTTLNQSFESMEEFGEFVNTFVTSHRIRPYDKQFYTFFNDLAKVCEFMQKCDSVNYDTTHPFLDMYFGFKQFSLKSIISVSVLIPTFLILSISVFAC